MSKAIFTCFGPYGLQYAKKLVDNYGWEALYLYSDKVTYFEIKRDFPDAIIHDFYDSLKIIPPPELKNLVLDPIDPAWLDEFAVHESVCMNMMERNDPSGTFRYKDRLRLYHDALRYWSTVLRLLKPDFIIQEEEPHQVMDYVLQIVGQKLGIRCIMFLRLPFFRMYPVDDFRKGSIHIINNYKNKLANYKGEDIPLEASINDYLNKIRSTYDINKHLYNQVEELKNLGIKENRVLSTIKKIAKFTKYFNPNKFIPRVISFFILFQTALEQEQKSKFGDFRTSKRSYLEYNLTVAGTKRFKKKMKSYYDSITNQQLDLSTSYVVYALNFQPERTTSPIGGHFVNQLLAIDLIAKNLPQGWKLYVKEHPSQFIYMLLGDTYRSKKFYDDIASISNVELIPLIYDNYKLIDNSKAVATVTGTMAWEAVIREKPAIVFGHTWFNPCEGIIYVSSEAEIKEAIQKIESGFRPSFNKVKLFVKTLEECSYKAFVGGHQEYLYSNISHETNAEEHLNAILDFIKNN